MNTIDMRLQEATALLDTLYDQVTLTHADLWQAEQRHAKAVADANQQETQELDQWMQSEQYYRNALQEWQTQQSEEARAALQRKKTWWHRLLVLFACLFSSGLFLILEVREIQMLQSKRDNPPFGELQRTWSSMLTDARRKIDALRFPRNPRSTPEMKEAEQELFSLRKKRDLLEHQIVMQEARVTFLQQQRSSSSSI